MGQMASPDVGRMVAELGKVVSEKYVSTTLFERIKSSLDTFPYEAERGKLPYAVVMPESRDEIREIMKYANSTRIPIFVRGSGTSFTGASRYHAPGIVLSTRRLNSIVRGLRILRMRAGVYLRGGSPGNREARIFLALGPGKPPHRKHGRFNSQQHQCPRGRHEHRETR